jgi:hypothetical protein
VIEFPTSDAYSNLDLTIAIYSIRRLSRVEKEKVIVRINPNNFIACENKNLHVDENGVLKQYALPDP